MCQNCVVMSPVYLSSKNLGNDLLGGILKRHISKKLSIWRNDLTNAANILADLREGRIECVTF